MTKELLIGTTFGQEATEEWLFLQRRFLDKYTKQYDIVFCLHEVENEEPFTGADVIHRCSGDLLVCLPEMFNKIFQTFRENKYKNYLLLDSDAFPIKKDWYDHLQFIMEERQYAAPIRPENLDPAFPHPSALFIRGDYIKEPFDFSRKDNEYTNFLGNKLKDIGTSFITKDVFFPLLRSNVYNAHPILSAIYGDIFYHHGGGSRMPFFRSSSYWKKINDNWYEKQDCYEKLVESPDKYIASLRGI